MARGLRERECYSTESVTYRNGDTHIRFLNSGACFRKVLLGPPRVCRSVMQHKLWSTSPSTLLPSTPPPHPPPPTDSDKPEPVYARGNGELHGAIWSRLGHSPAPERSGAWGGGGLRGSAQRVLWERIAGGALQPPCQTGKHIHLPATAKQNTPDDTSENLLLHGPFSRKPKRIRTAFSPSQLLRLERAFEKNHYVYIWNMDLRQAALLKFIHRNKNVILSSAPLPLTDMRLSHGCWVCLKLETTVTPSHL
ncbi:hypothetical protein JZ751_027451 [Albula glossodonta]|uniref:Uncharacterized protein n=1 Tax=Albula glossodonta TaxID=121402 RepID=A0A8T2MWK4_9TELE|nr:hypothetical protein JZ751_027451 [Albula glossodonta]